MVLKDVVLSEQTEAVVGVWTDALRQFLRPKKGPESGTDPRFEAASESNLGLQKLDDKLTFESLDLVKENHTKNIYKLLRAIAVLTRY